MKKSFLTLLYVLLLFLVGCNEDQKSANVVVFEDANFEKIVRNAIKETIDAEFEGPITQKDLEKLGQYFSKADLEPHLNYMSITADVKSVAGIEFIDGLQHLFIFSDQVDLSSINKLNSLLSATIQTHSSIDDITPLNKVVSLSIISTEFNVEQLDSFSKLINFYMFSDSVSAQGVLKNLHKNAHLKSLVLQSSNGDLEGVEDLIAFPQLKTLNFEGNQVHDITPLKQLENLMEITISENEIEDIEVLLELPNLERIFLGENPLDEESNEIIEKLVNKNIEVID